MPTQIENIRKRTEKNMMTMGRDIITLLATIEDRGILIDSLAREREVLEAKLTAIECGSCEKNLLECKCDDLEEG